VVFLFLTGFQNGLGFCHRFTDFLWHFL